MREHRKMTLKRIGIGILCMVFVLSMLAPLVAFAEEKTESETGVKERACVHSDQCRRRAGDALCLRRGRRYPSFGSM